MKRLLFTALALTGTVEAQQTAKVTFAPVIIDGLTTPNGLVTIDGKTYVSVDALKTQGVTMLKSGSLGVYRFPNAQGQSVKLQGCLNEWLTDGITRVRIQSVKPDEFYKTWVIAVEFMTSKDSERIREVFPERKEMVTLQKGQVLDANVDAFVQFEMTNYSASRGKSETTYLKFTTPDWSTANAPVKLVLNPSSNRQVRGAWTFDLTCGKTN